MRSELVRASDLLRTNTPESVEEAIGLLQGTVFSFSMKMCGHREDAEDTAQDVLFSSLKHLQKLDNPGALTAWLYTVAKNRCRRKRSKANVSDNRHISLEELMPTREEIDLLLHAPGYTPETEVLKEEEFSFLQQAILRLPIPLRMVLVLHDMEELSAEEVARILDLKEVTVRVRLHRARLAVRKELSRLVRGAPIKSGSSRKSAIRRTKACCATFANLSEYIDARVERVNCEQMREHIEKCPECVAFLKDLKSAIDRCRSFQAECDPRIDERIRHLMTKEYLRLTGMGTASAQQR